MINNSIDLKFGPDAIKSTTNLKIKSLPESIRRDVLIKNSPHVLNTVVFSNSNF